MVSYTKCFFFFIVISLSCQSFAIVDPTRPPNTNTLSVTRQTTKKEAPLQVTGIIKIATGYKALINGKSYRVGEKINGLTIIKITAYDVYFSDGQSDFKMPIARQTSTGIQISKSKPY